MKQLSLLDEEQEQKIVVFDIETQKSFAEISAIQEMRVAAAVLYSYTEDKYKIYTEENVQELIKELLDADVIVGYNHIHFDFKVLNGYTDKTFNNIDSVDMMRHAQKSIGFRPKLNNLVSATLGESKSADGLQSLQWFKEGKINKVIEYCQQDVKVTKELYEFGRDNGFIYNEGFNGKQKITVNW